MPNLMMANYTAPMKKKRKLLKRLRQRALKPKLLFLTAKRLKWAMQTWAMAMPWPRMTMRLLTPAAKT
jgi:hypothetical protein